MPDVLIENLRTLASVGDGKTFGSRLGHGAIRFQFAPPAVRSFTFDDWTNIGDASANPSKADLRGAVNWAHQVDCDSALHNWERTDSFFARIAKELFFGANLPADWCNPGADTAYITLPLRAGVTLPNAPEQWLFMLLVSGAAIAYWRERTGVVLNISSVRMQTLKAGSAAKAKPAVPADYDLDTIELDWPTVLRRMRTMVRTWVKQRYPATGSYDAATLDLNTDLIENAERLPGIKKLVKGEYLVAEPHGNGYDIRPSKKLFVGESLENDRHDDLKVALNHARFIMWMDWRIGTELCLRQSQRGIWS